MPKKQTENMQIEPQENWSWTGGVAVEVVDRSELLAAAKKGERSAIMEQPVYSDNPPPLTPEEARAKGILEHHRGRANALKVRLFAELLGVEERRAQQIVKCLVEKHNILIGSAVSPPFGYYIPETAEEVDAVLAQLYHRMASMAVRIARIKRISVEEVFGQLRLLESNNEL